MNPRCCRRERRVLAVFLAFLCFSSLLLPRPAQAGENLNTIFEENRFRIVSQKAVFDLRAPPRVLVETEIAAEAIRETDVLVFSLPECRVESARIGEAEAPARLEGGFLEIRPPAPLHPGDRALVRLLAAREIPEKDVEACIARAFFPLELPRDAFDDFPISACFRVPDGSAVMSDGVFAEVRPGKGFREFQWEIPAGPRHWDLLWVKGDLFRRSANGVDFLLASALGDETGIKVFMDVLVEVYSFVEGLFGPLASRRLFVAQTPAADRAGTRFNTGGLICLQTGDLDRLRDPWLAGCLAHEIAHEWWGGVVFGHSEDGQVVKECMAELASIHFQEKKLGRENAWEDAIVNTMAYLEGDRRAVAETEDELYSKSILMYRHLLHVVGETAFFQAAREILRVQAGKQVSHAMFFEAAGKAAGKDVRWLLQWLYRTNADLDFSLSEVRWEGKGERVLTRIGLVERVGRFDYPLEVPVRVETADGKVLDFFARIGRAGAVLAVETDAPVRSVAVDPEWMFWDVDRSNNFFGTHVASAKASPADPGTVAEVAGGFKSRYEDRIWASLWVRRGNWAFLVPLAGERLTAEPKLLWTGDGKTLFLVFCFEPLRGIRADLAKEEPAILPLVPEDPVAEVCRRAIEEERKQLEEAWRKKAEELGRRWAADGDKSVIEEMERIREKEPRQDLAGAVGAMAATFLYLKEPRSPELRESAFRLLFHVACNDNKITVPFVKENMRVLLEALADPSAEVRDNAAYFFRIAPSAEALEPLCRSVLMDTEKASYQAICALEKIGDPRAVPALVRILGFPGLWDRWNAARALCRIPDPRSVEPLILALEKEDPSKYSEVERGGMIPENPDPARKAYAEALAAITGQTFGMDAKAWREWRAKGGGK